MFYCCGESMHATWFIKNEYKLTWYNVHLVIARAEDPGWYKIRTMFMTSTYPDGQGTDYTRFKGTRHINTELAFYAFLKVT